MQATSAGWIPASARHVNTTPQGEPRLAAIGRNQRSTRVAGTRRRPCRPNAATSSAPLRCAFAIQAAFGARTQCHGRSSPAIRARPSEPDRFRTTWVTSGARAGASTNADLDPRVGRASRSAHPGLRHAFAKGNEVTLVQVNTRLPSSPTATTPERGLNLRDHQIHVELLRIERVKPQPFPPASRARVQRAHNHRAARSLLIQFNPRGEHVRDHRGPDPEVGVVEVHGQPAEQQSGNGVGRLPCELGGSRGAIDRRHRHTRVRDHDILGIGDHPGRGGIPAPALSGIAPKPLELAAPVQRPSKPLPP